MSLAAGARLGPYRILRRLGAGAMGVVYQAHDDRLGRDVAIKVLPDGVAADEDMVARFEREVRAIAALSHPNVLGIYDIALGGAPTYAVMELVRGRELRDLLQAGPLPAETAVDYARQLARGLAAAHARGVVHRDLKPENVLVTGEGLLKILDFGLAKFDPLGLGGGNDATLFGTVPGVVLGTLAYMAPEQLRGEVVDHRADIFAWGAILFEMLAGRPPFGRATAAETIAALLSDAGPDEAALASMPPAIGALVADCLAKAAAGRPESAAAALARLDAGAAGGTWIAAATTAPSRATGETAVATAPAAGTPRAIAVLPFADMSPARDQDYFCEGMAEEIIATLARVRGLRVVARTSAFRFKGQQADVREIGRALGVEAVLEGSVRTAGGRMRVTAQLVSAADGYQLWTERFDGDAADVFAVQDAIAGAVSEMLTASIATHHRTIVPPSRPASLDAYTLYLKGRHLWSRRTGASLQRSLACFRDALEADAGYAQAWAGLADSYLTIGLYGLQAPSDAMPLAADAACRALAQHPDLAAAHATLASVSALHDWDWPAAAEGFDRALAADPNLAVGWQWRAMHLHVPQRRFTDAGADLARAAELDPMSPAVAASRGLHAHLSGDAAGGIALLDQAIERDPRAAVLHFFRGLVLADEGRPAEATAAIALALAHGDRTPEMAAATGYAAAASGRREGADAALAELAGLAASRYVSPVIGAQIRARLGETDAALDALERAADLRAPDLVWIAARPAFRSLHGHPRFERLLARVGLPAPG